MANDLPSLRVQVVLYQNDTVSLARLLETVQNSLLRASAGLSGWVIALGDSSPFAVYSPEEVVTLQRSVLEAGGRLEYLFFDENLGHGGGHNRLHMQSVESLLLILNPDGILAPDSIQRLVRALTPEYGVVDARQLPLEHPKEYDPETGETSWSSLACALTTSAVFREVGGIDHDTFFMYCDDVDYSWRVRLTGRKVRYCPEARMFHDKRMDADGQMQASETEHYYSAEAALMLAHKYSRNEILAIRLSEMERSGNEFQQRAAREFRERRSTGRLPAQIDSSHSVAEFTRGTYGAHRY